MNFRRRLDCVGLWFSIAPVAIIAWTYVLLLMVVESACNTAYGAATSRKRIKPLTRASG